MGLQLHIGRLFRCAPAAVLEHKLDQSALRLELHGRGLESYGQSDLWHRPQSLHQPPAKCAVPSAADDERLQRGLHQSRSDRYQEIRQLGGGPGCVWLNGCDNNKHCSTVTYVDM